MNKLHILDTCDPNTMNTSAVAAITKNNETIFNAWRKEHLKGKTTKNGTFPVYLPTQAI